MRYGSDTGELHQLVHLWCFDSDEDRRAFWKRLFENAEFMAFAKQLRPLVKTQANQLLLAAPWGPHPCSTRLRDQARWRLKCAMVRAHASCAAAAS